MHTHSHTHVHASTHTHTHTHTRTCTQRERESVSHCGASLCLIRAHLYSVRTKTWCSSNCARVYLAHTHPQTKEEPTDSISYHHHLFSDLRSLLSVFLHLLLSLSLSLSRSLSTLTSDGQAGRISADVVQTFRNSIPRLASASCVCVSVCVFSPG